MKTNRRPLRVLLLVAVTGILFSFTSRTNRSGGEWYDFHINNQLVGQCMPGDTKQQEVVIPAANRNDDLLVRYSHCGKLGTGRRIIIRDAQQKLLQEWQYTDGAGNHDRFMLCRISDIAAKAGHQTVALYYYAKELGREKLLTNLRIM